MSVFHFKQFDVANERSSMKVNTDGVILGAAATLSASDRRVLDAGTGTGTIALMLAQRYHSAGVPCTSSPLATGAGMPTDSALAIVGIDIDAPSAAEAGVNFSISRWAGVLEARHCALRDYFPEEPLDLIVSNPPYYDDSLLPPEARRGIARHTGGAALSFADLADFSREHLRSAGRLSVILPADQERNVRRYAVSCGLYPFRILRIRTTPRKEVSRIVLEFGLLPCDTIDDSTLTIQDPASWPDNKNGYTPEYLALTGDFYL